MKKLIIKRLSILCLTLLLSFSLNAQLPNSDVWLFSYSVQQGIYSFTYGKNVSNKPGYDNQPFFSKDGLWMLYTSEQDSGQTDIIQYNIKLGQLNQFTKSSESEYSPEYFSTKNSFTDVVVEKDSTQRLWKYSYHLDYEYPQATILFPEVKNVAYSRWFNDSIVFLCILPEPMNLFVANVNSGIVSKCAMNVNRSMCVYHQKNRDLFLYSQMKADSSYCIQALSNTGAHVSNFMSIPFVKGSQDFTVDKLGHVFMASGTKLYLWTIGQTLDWKLIGDFAPQGLTKITRLMVSPDGKHIALVDNQL